MEDFAIVKINQAEMALRILEAMAQIKRPDIDGKTPAEILGMFSEDARDKSLEAAVSVMEYIASCLQDQLGAHMMQLNKQKEG